ncbi:MAG: gliding motility-associated C-terminal domain-containing protein [Bacteroidetes bacterium]|jgi:gliding motility-associated-like protein|nr:gliding motility-associated C-terminal domain-containing protein [Bacteroidota bacterium]
MSISTPSSKVCLDNSLVLQAQGVPTGSDYTWYFGNQTIDDDLDSVRFLAIKTGEFKPYLMVKTPLNLSCKVELGGSGSIEVVGKPDKLSLEAKPGAELCELPATVTITAKGGGSGLWYTYIIETHGNGALDYLYRSRSAKAAVSHTIYHPGYKRVILEIENANGCKTNVVVDSMLKAFDLPKPSFTVSDPLTCDKKTVNYTSTLSHSASVSYAWEFTGGQPSTSQLPNPSNIAYEGKGKYPTKLTISNNEGCSEVFEMSDAVVIGSEEKLRLSLDPTNVCAGQEIQLLLSGNQLDKTAITWNLPSAKTLSTNGANTLKRISYPASGTYSVGVDYQVGGCLTSLVYEDTLIVTQVTAAFSTAYACHCSPGQLTVVNKSKSSDPMDQVRYEWAITDKNGKVIITSKEAEPQFQLPRYGEYTLKLVATGKKGCQSEASQKVKLSPLKADFTTNAENLCLGEPFEATVNEKTTCLYNIDTILWTLTDKNGQVVATQLGGKFNYTPTQPGLYSLTLYVKNKSGCSDSKTIYNTLKSYQIKSSVTTSGQYLCMGSEVELTSSNAPFNIATTNQWTLIDPNTKSRFTGTGTGLKFPITEAGTFDVYMIARLNNLCADTVVLPGQFKVSGAKAEIRTSTRASCVPFTDQAHVLLLYNVQHTQPNPSVRYSWGSTNSSGISITQPYNDTTEIYIDKSDYYGLTIKLTNGEGCVTQFTHTRAYEAGVIASFASNSTACIDIPLATSNTSKLGANKFQWLVFDTSSMVKPKPRAPSPKLVFSSTGQHKVGLVATNDLGCADTTYRDIHVIDFDFGFASDESKSLLCAPALVKFDIVHTNVDSFVWLFGDGSSLGTSMQQTGHFYDILNLDNEYEYYFDVKLVALSKHGCADTLSKDSFIKMAGPRPRFVADTTLGSERLSVEFFSFNEGVSYYLFDYGDQSSVDSNTIRPHLYLAGDTSMLYTEYRPRMVAFDDRGCSRSFDGLPIRVYSAAQARFLADTLVGCGHLSVQLKNFSTFTDSFAWYLNKDDSAFSHERNPQLILGPGLHSITLKAYNVAGIASTEKKPAYIQVFRNPMVAIGLDKLRQCTDHTLTFTDLSLADNPITKHVWDFNPISPLTDTSSGARVVRLFKEAGFKAIRLTVRDAFGCQAEKTWSDTLLITTPRPILHGGIGLASYDDNKVIRLHIENDNLEGTHGFMAHELLPQGPQALFAIGRPRDSLLGPGAHLFRPLSSQPAYQLSTVNDCGDTVEVGTAHRPVRLTITPGDANFFPTLEWTAYEGWDNISAYQVFRSTNGEKPELLASLPPGSRAFTDSQVCQQRYTYSVQAIRSAPNYTTYSNTDTISPDYQAPVGSNQMWVTTVIDNKYLLTTWQRHPHPQVNRYVVTRTDPNFGTVTNHALVYDTFYLDTIRVYPDRDIYSYQITGSDYCNSPTDPSASIGSVVIALQRDDLHTVAEWNLAQGWPIGTWYYLERAGEDGYFETIYSTQTATQFADEEVYQKSGENLRYRIRAQHGERQAWSNTVSTLPDMKVFIPNAFSPNGDGVNDVFMVSGSGALNGSEAEFDNFRLTIFNRWSEVVYESTDIAQGWNGFYHGQRVAIGVYRYRVVLRDKSGKFTHAEGSITLLQ